MKVNRPLITALFAFIFFAAMAIGLARLAPIAAGHQLSDITLSDRASGALSEVRVKNSWGSYSLVRTDGSLSCLQLQDLPVSEAALENFAQNCTSVHATSGVKLPEDEALLGFDRPRAVVEIIFADETFLTLTIGDANEEETGYYVRLADDGPIYLLSQKDAAPFFAAASSYLDLTLTDNPADSSALAQEIVLETPSQKLSVSRNDSDLDSAQYTVSDGTISLAADEESLASFFGSLGNLCADSVIQIYPSNAELQSYGILDASGAPVQKLSFSMGGAQTQLIIGNRSGDSYYVYKEGVSAVFTLPLSQASWDGASLFRLMRRTPLLPDATELSCITVETAGARYDILPDETGLVASVNDISLSDRTFGQLYNLLFSFEAQYVLDDALQNILPELTLTLTYRLPAADGSPRVDVVRFIPYGLRRHAIEINGMALWAVRSGYVQQVETVFRTLQDGVSISSVW